MTVAAWQEYQQSLNPKYDYDSAIRRRLGTIDNIGADANARLAQLLEQRQSAAYTTSQDNVETPAVGNLGGSDFRSRLLASVAKYKGVKYTWGGTSVATGFDCSGLVQKAYADVGIKMPRVAAAQASTGKVTPIQNLRPGDLVAWGKSPATAHHIAVYAGNGQIWEAPRTGLSVRLRPVMGDKEAFGISLSYIP